MPRFVETSLLLGRMQLGFAHRTGGRKARSLLDEAYARFPKSPAATYLSGQLRQVVGDCRGALQYYDETLGIKKTHEDALLGQTICLSVLKEHEAAIAVASHILQLGTYHQGSAYYWRAWNRHHRKELPQAREDVESARKQLYNTSVLTLAGIIEHDQDDLLPAEQDLKLAVELDERNCPAIWYQALVQLKRQRWPNTAAQFVSAMKCYEATAKEGEQELWVLRHREDVEPDYKARQIATLETTIKEARDQESASAFNAAMNYLRARDVAKATEYADIAARDPARLPRVEELRKIIRDIK